MVAQDIVIRPVITEKSMAGMGMKKYTFEVAPKAGKIEIARAVEELFGVKVKKVNTLHVRGHLRRQGPPQAGEPLPVPPQPQSPLRPLRSLHFAPP